MKSSVKIKKKKNCFIPVSLVSWKSKDLLVSEYVTNFIVNLIFRKLLPFLLRVVANFKIDSFACIIS